MLSLFISLLAAFELGHVLTIISISVGFAVGLLQVYITMRQAKLKEEMLDIMRKEMETTVERLELKMVTHQDFLSLKENLKLMFDNIRLEMERNQYQRMAEYKDKNEPKK